HGWSSSGRTASRPQTGWRSPAAAWRDPRFHTPAPASRTSARAPAIGPATRAASPRTARPGTAICDSSKPREYGPEDVERVLVAVGQGADANPEVCGHLEAIAGCGQHATLGQRLAQGPRIAAVTQPREARGAAGGRGPADGFAVLVHEPGEQRQIAARRGLQPRMDLGGIRQRMRADRLGQRRAGDREVAA